jgi:hypothetical protein
VDIDLENFDIKQLTFKNLKFKKSYRTLNYVVLESDDKLEVYELNEFKKIREVTQFTDFQLSENDDILLVHTGKSIEQVNLQTGKSEPIREFKP